MIRENIAIHMACERVLEKLKEFYDGVRTIRNMEEK